VQIKGPSNRAVTKPLELCDTVYYFLESIGAANRTGSCMEPSQARENPEVVCWDANAEAHMGKFFNEESARCARCGTLLTSLGLARNGNHLYKLGTMYGCDCGASKVWTNSIRNEQALLAYWTGAKSSYMQGFCNDLFDGEGREIVPLRSVDFPGEEQRGQVYVPQEQVNAPKSLSLVVWTGRFWPELEGKELLVEQYRVYADEIARLVAEPRRNPARLFFSPAAPAALLGRRRPSSPT
jgi:hypothetical protein